MSQRPLAGVVGPGPSATAGPRRRPPDVQEEHSLPPVGTTGPGPLRGPAAGLVAALATGLLLASLRSGEAIPDPAWGLLARWSITAIENSSRTACGIGLLVWALFPGSAERSPYGLELGAGGPRSYNGLP